MNKVLFYAVLIFWTVLFIYPFLWMLSATLRPEAEIGGFGIIPSSISLESYITVVEKIPIWRAFFNSLVVATSVTVGVIVFSSMVGYALSRLRFRGRNLIFSLILFTMTLPFQITLIPQYILMVKFHWTESYLALIVPYLINAFAIILFRQHFLTIPQDLVDAARMDGCSEFRILFRIFWPLSVPAIVTVGIITFMTVWNEVLWPLIVIHERDLMTMPQLVTIFVVGGQAESLLGAKLAAATLLALPIVIAYSIFQRYFIESLATTGLKG
ncbi:MAG: carbohydrate ABC transporter permease [candidate division KSB1 bacterium]|nr:carbohydrate ABC transporter permease [candidate division KSB1 bacterium]